MEGDYKVPPKLAEKIIKAYKSDIVTDPDSGELQYLETLDVFAEHILEDYDEAKKKRVFGQSISDPDEMAKWLQYNLPDMFEILLKMNNEL